MRNRTEAVHPMRRLKQGPDVIMRDARNIIRALERVRSDTTRPKEVRDEIAEHLRAGLNLVMNGRRDRPVRVEAEHDPALEVTDDEDARHRGGRWKKDG